MTALSLPSAALRRAFSLAARLRIALDERRETPEGLAARCASRDLVERVREMRALDEARTAPRDAAARRRAMWRTHGGRDA